MDGSKPRPIFFPFPDRRFCKERLLALLRVRRSFEGVLKCQPGLFINHEKPLIQRGLFRLFANAAVQTALVSSASYGERMRGILSGIGSNCVANSLLTSFAYTVYYSAGIENYAYRGYH